MTAMRLPYPPSSNRYWRIFRGRAVRSAEASQYAAAVAHFARVAGYTRISVDPVTVAVVLHPKRTKSGAASKTRIDLDNCVKVTLDALQGVAYANDKQIVRLLVEVGEPIEAGGLSVLVGAA